MYILIEQRAPEAQGRWTNKEIPLVNSHYCINVLSFHQPTRECVVVYRVIGDRDGTGIQLLLFVYKALELK